MLFLALPSSMGTACLSGVLGKVVVWNEKRNASRWICHYFAIVQITWPCLQSLMSFGHQLDVCSSEELFSFRPAWAATADFNTESKFRPPRSVSAIQTLRTARWQRHLAMTVQATSEYLPCSPLKVRCPTKQWSLQQVRLAVIMSASTTLTAPE